MTTDELPRWLLGAGGENREVHCAATAARGGSSRLRQPEPRTQSSPMFGRLLGGAGGPRAGQPSSPPEATAPDHTTGNGSVVVTTPDKVRSMLHSAPPSKPSPSHAPPHGT